MHTMVEILDELVAPDSELHILSVLEADVREERLRTADMRTPQNMRLQHFVGSHVQRTDLPKLAEHCGPEGLVSHTKSQPKKASLGHISGPLPCLRLTFGGHTSCDLAESVSKVLKRAVRW